MLRGSAALAALTTATVIAVGGPASASSPTKAGATVITMEQDGKELYFEGPATVEAGATLKIKNKTNPRKIGPHTFSLVREADLPVTEEEIKECAKKFVKICGAIIEWHKVDLQTGEIGENPVEVGKEGWDTKGSLKRKGDSWVSEGKGESFAREVTAPEGKTLQYFCAVHPEMQGEIKVGG
jgi:plastocyanin